MGNILHLVADWLKANPDEPAIPQAFVERMLETNERLAREAGQRQEREELVCRLLASDMSVDEVSLILKIRKEEIGTIQRNNNEYKIPDYAKKLKGRRKSRERNNKNEQQCDTLKDT